MQSDRESFERWFFGSKYGQVAPPAKAAEQAAWDGWQAAIVSMLDAGKHDVPSCAAPHESHEAALAEHMGLVEEFAELSHRDACGHFPEGGSRPAKGKVERSARRLTSVPRDDALSLDEDGAVSIDFAAGGNLFSLSVTPEGAGAFAWLLADGRKAHGVVQFGAGAFAALAAAAQEHD